MSTLDFAALHAIHQQATAAALGAGRWFTRDAELANRPTTDSHPPTTPPPK